MDHRHTGYFSVYEGRSKTQSGVTDNYQYFMHWPENWNNIMLYNATTC